MMVLELASLSVESSTHHPREMGQLERVLLIPSPPADFGEGDVERVLLRPLPPGGGGEGDVERGGGSGWRGLEGL